MEITTELANRLIDTLPYGEERDELMSLLPSRNNEDREKTVTIIVKESEASHFAHAFRIGSTSAMMCGNHKKVVASLREASEKAETIVPTVFSEFLHQSDVEKICEMFRYETVDIDQVNSWGSSEIVFRRDGKNDFKPFLKGEAEKEKVKKMIVELQEIYEKYKEKQ